MARLATKLEPLVTLPRGPTKTKSLAVPASEIVRLVLSVLKYGVFDARGVSTGVVAAAKGKLWADPGGNGNRILK